MVVHYWTDLQSVHGFHGYDNIAPNAKCQRVLVLGLCLVVSAAVFTHVDAVTVVEIMAGSIFFEDNYDLCFVNTILWSDVVTHRRSNISINLQDPSRPPAKCNCLS